MKLEFSRQFFFKYSNTKFHENPSSVSRVVPCGPTDRLTDMTKLIVAYCNLTNAPESVHFKIGSETRIQSKKKGNLNRRHQTM